MALMPTISRQARTQRAHSTQASLSGNVILARLTPREAANATMAGTSYAPASNSSAVMRLLRCTAGDSVLTAIPSSHGYVQAATRRGDLDPDWASTMQRRHAPYGSNAGWKQKVGKCTPCSRQASRMVRPGSTATGWSLMVSCITLVHLYRVKFA